MPELQPQPPRSADEEIVYQGSLKQAQEAARVFLDAGFSSEDVLRDLEKIYAQYGINAQEVLDDAIANSASKTDVDDEPEPAAVESEPPPEQEPEQEPAGKLKSIADRFKQKADLFIREHFKGEHAEEEPSTTQTTKITKTIGSSVVGALASLGGIKVFTDLPRWLAQRKYTKKERERIQAALDQSGVEADLEADAGAPDAPAVTAVDIKKRRLEKAVTESKYLSPEKKTELLEKLNLAVDQYEHEVDVSKKMRDEKIADLLETTIQSRVKGTTALKETLNTALMLTGLSTLRGLGYGAVALYERHVAVKKEIKNRERTESYAKEMIINGFKETWQKLAFQKGETKLQRAINFGQALGTVIRFSGFASLAGFEWFGEDVSEEEKSEAIDKALKALEEKGKGVADATEPVTASDSPAVPAEVAGEPEAADELAPEPEATEPVTASDSEAVPAEVAGEPEAAETTTYISQDELETGTVHKGDGVIRVVQRQLKADPEKYGFTGNPADKKAITKWVRKMAFEATKKAGLVNEDGWLGLRGKAIDNLSIGVTNESGELKFNFFDAKTGQSMSMEEMRERGLVHDYHKPDEGEEREGREAKEDRWEQAWTDAQAKPDEPIELTAAAKATQAEMEAEGEVKGASVDTGETAVELSPLGKATLAEMEAEPTEPVTASDSEAVPAELAPEPAEKLFEFKLGDEKVTFRHVNGRIDVELLRENVTGVDLAMAAERFGTSKGEIFKGFVDTNPEGRTWVLQRRADALLYDIDAQTRVDHMLEAMKKQGLDNTDEYGALKKYDGTLKSLIQKTFTKIGLKEKLKNAGEEVM